MTEETGLHTDKQSCCSHQPIRAFPHEFQTVARSKSYTKKQNLIKYGLDVVTKGKDLFSMNVGGSLSMYLPKVPQRIDLKTYSSFTDSVGKRHCQRMTLPVSRSGVSSAKAEAQLTTTLEQSHFLLGFARASFVNAFLLSFLSGPNPE